MQKSPNYILQFVFSYAKIVKSNRNGGTKMEILQTILIIVYVIVCLALIIVALRQNSEDEGASSTIVGSSSSSFYEKNKGRTREGQLKKWTIILGVIFVILTIVLGIVYML